MTAREAIASSAVPVIFWLGIATLILWSLPDRAWYIKTKGLYFIGIIGIWRYTWVLLNFFRAMYWCRVKLPKLRKAADALPRKYPRRLYFLIPSYHEDRQVTRRVFCALIREIQSLPSEVIAAVSVGSQKEADYIDLVVKSCPGFEKVKLIFLFQAHGKRVAMGHGLRAIARNFNTVSRWHQDAHNDLVVFMDGDSMLGEGALTKSLPFFRLMPRLGAVTTDEIGIVLSENNLVRQWFDLRFIKRHNMMASHSLSGRVLTLTGRFSVFRAHIVLGESFIRDVEADHLEHWNFGRFRFLMGDDKSTWFNLLKKRCEMLYLPDTVIHPLESRRDPFVEVTASLMHRWSGNMLRNNWRAIRLGPWTCTPFIWLCLWDQRISMWTTLMAPVGVILLSITTSVFYLPFYLAWVILTRTAHLSALAHHGYRVRVSHLWLLVYDQWIGSIVKIKCLFNLHRQTWQKATVQKIEYLDVSFPRLRKGVAYYRMIFGVAALALFAGLFSGALSVAPMFMFLPASSSEASGKGDARVLHNLVIDAAKHGVIADDENDDAATISKLIQTAPTSANVMIVLPVGTLRFDSPLVINRGNVIIRGQGKGRTFIESAMAVDQAAPEQGVIVVKGKKGPRLGGLIGPIAARADSFSLENGHELGIVGPFVWLGAANDQAFFEHLGNPFWQKDFPWLRQWIAAVKGITVGSVVLRDPLNLAFPDGTIVHAPQMTENVGLEEFSITHKAPGLIASEAKSVYENLCPDHALDSIRFQWAAFSWIRNVNILMSGRHPLVFESSYGIHGRDLHIDGSWNKGPGGNGYVRFSRAFRCELRNSLVESIRHVAFQWSAAGNLVADSLIKVDVNFHGGYSHHNVVRNCIIEPPKEHPWPPVSTTPLTAHWAPPDGPQNKVE
jgi:glycosyltransferase Alg8